MSEVAVPAIAEAFRAHERLLWGLGYRMTGCAADADDIVQETFVRALQHPPEDTTQPWRPWLVQVAMNLGRDALRRRRRRGYVGPWLPSPIAVEEEPPAVEATLADGRTTEGRYDLLESVSFAFLLALEALTPQQRAVLLLRDVFDYSVSDTAAALSLSEANVKTTHHRARRAMAAYDREQRPPLRGLAAATRAMLDQFVAALASGKASAVEELLAGAARAINDGGGEFRSGRVPVVGAARVARFYTKITAGRPVQALGIQTLNGQPALVVELAPGRPGWATRSVLLLDLDATDRIRTLYTVLATRKLTAVQFPDAAADGN